MHTRTTLLTIGLAAVTALAPALRAQEAPPAPGEPRPFTIPEAREFTLDNGMAVTLIPYGAVPKASVSLAIRAGNSDEGPEEVWLADITGDLMQEGTTSRTAEQIAAEAAAMGGSLGIGVSANQTTVAADALSEFIPSMIALVADVAVNPSFPEAPLERIRTDRIRQLSIERSQPQALAVEKFRSVLYPGHAYGRLYPTVAMLQAYGVDQARAFHATHFSAARAHLYVAGAFDVDATEAAVRAAFGEWATGTAVAPGVPSPQSVRSIYLVDNPGAVQSTIYMGLPVVDPSNPDYIPLLVTNALLGGSFASRITSNIREQKGYTYSPFSSVSARYRDAYWAEQADVTTAVTGPALKEILFEIDRLRAEPPSAEELEGIQNYLAGTFVLQNSSRAGIIGQLTFVNLHGLGRQWLNEYVQRVHAVTPAEVTRIAQTYLDPGRMTIVVAGDRGQIAGQLAEFGEILQ